MKCNACGAPVENGVCTYCGKKFPLADAADAVRQETNTEEKPLTFEAKVTLIEETAEEAASRVSNSGGFWKKVGIVLLWIYFFPIMLTIWLVKTPKLTTQMKAILLAVFWVGFIILGIIGAVTDPETLEYETTAVMIAAGLF